MSYRFAGVRQAGAYTFAAAAGGGAAWASYRHGEALVPAAYQFGGGGLGVLGVQIPDTGTHGPSILFNDLAMPRDAGIEVRCLVDAPPLGLATFFVHEDGSFVATGPDGNYAFTYRLFADGAELGTAAVALTFA